VARLRRLHACGTRAPEGSRAEARGGRGYASLVALIEKYENDFGLTPKGRQALRWKVEDEETIETLRNDELETQRNVRRLRAVDPDLEGANE
jgi:hypothetical protein